MRGKAGKKDKEVKEVPDLLHIPYLLGNREQNKVLSKRELTAVKRRSNCDTTSRRPKSKRESWVGG